MPASGTLATTAVDAFAVSGNNIFAGTDSGSVYRSTDGGKNWSVASNHVANSAWVSALAISSGTTGSANTRLFAGTDVGVFLSTDSGATWRGTGATGNPVWALVLHGTNLFAGIGGGVSLSTDDGTNWKTVNNGLSYRGLLHSFAVSGTSLFAGTWGGGVFYSPDSGSTWTATNDGILASDVMINALVVSSTSGGAGEMNIFAGTVSDPWSNFSVLNGGVYRRPLTEIVAGIAMPRNGAPAIYRLEQNFPNPFNPTTTIRYALPVRSQVTLSVFNILGQQVATPVNGSQEAGIHDVQFDGGGLASGVYFYRIHAGDFVQTKRLLVIR
jgi:hypothetical protein